MTAPSENQLLRHIRASARDSANVSWTTHAELQMHRRRLNRVMALEVLRAGVFSRPPEPDIRHPGVKCRMQRVVAGVEVAVVVAVEFPATELLVITVIDVRGA